MTVVNACRERLRETELHARIGRVCRLHGQAIEADGPPAALGELCRIVPPGVTERAGVLAEVVGLAGSRLTLLPHGELRGVGVGGAVIAQGQASGVPVGPALLGRVIDGFGAPLDGQPAPASPMRPLQAPTPGPLDRPPIRRVLETGIRAIDALLTLGQGQRVGVFAGSGVGKSTLLGMLARHAGAEVNVIALIGERGREVREFIDGPLGPQGLARSVLVVATAEQPALARVRAAHAAVAIAADFAQAGRQVLLVMDSLTRLAMARREIGLAAGEPATARGYTPSVFAELAQLCERCGTRPGGGSITALLSVLVEGDDLNEPVADCLRAVLDGHIVLSRELAQQGRFPAIDVLASTSRLFTQLASADEGALARRALRQLALLAKHRPMVDIGAWQPGANAALDAALAVEGPLSDWLCQAQGGVPRAQALRELAQVLSKGAAS